MFLIVLGGLFELAGAGVVVAVPLHAIDANLLVMEISFLVTGVPLVVGGFAMRRLTGRTPRPAYGARRQPLTWSARR
jgi:hypothetical protein